MGFNTFGYNNWNTNNTNNKTTFTKTIKTKQAMFNRFKRRFNATTNPTEKRFLKTECTRLCNELKTCAKTWTNSGYGNCNWITRGFSTSTFTSTKTGARKTRGSRKTTTKASNRTTRRSPGNRPTSSRRTTSRRNSNRRTTSYVAW